VAKPNWLVFLTFLQDRTRGYRVVKVRQVLLLLLDLAAVEVMGSLFSDPQRFADLSPRRAALTCRFHDVPAPAREQLDGLRVRTQRLKRCDFPYPRKELCCSLPRMIAAGGRYFAPCLAAVEVFPHFEQLVNITAAEGLLDRTRITIHKVKLA